jgi:hypothetical protein
MQRSRHTADPLAIEPATTPSPDAGCPFRHRCPFTIERCAEPLPTYEGPSRMVACHRYHELSPDRGASHNTPPTATLDISPSDARHPAELVRGAQPRSTA